MKVSFSKNARCLFPKNTSGYMKSSNVRLDDYVHGSSFTRVRLILTIVLSVATLPALAQTVPTDPEVTCSVSTAEFNSWFQAGSPSLNGVVNPANSVSFPNTPNCSFYEWAEQMFLWLTSPAPQIYGSGGRIFDSPTLFRRVAAGFKWESDVHSTYSGGAASLQLTPGPVRSEQSADSFR